MHSGSTDQDNQGMETSRVVVPAAAPATRNGPPLRPLSLSHAEKWLDSDDFWAQLDLDLGFGGAGAGAA